jgi:predicted RNase H-like HicB family nuclease
MNMSSNIRLLEISGGPCYTQGMSLSAYIDAALASARFKTLEDKTCYGEIPGFKGAWANAKTLKKCRETLREVLEDWIVLKLRSDEALPAVRGKRLTLPELTRA